MELKPSYYQDTADPHQALSVWEDVSKVLESALKSCPEAKQRAFFQVLGNSNFLARWVRRHPESVAHLLKRDWDHAYGVDAFKKEIKKLMARISPHAEARTVYEKLLHFKYEHFWRITARDIGLNVPFPVIAAEISHLAETILEWTYHWERNRLADEWGEPKGQKKPYHPIPFSLLAMGKLGGQELNYSSDVDLIYVYETDQARPQRRRQTFTPHEFFSKLAERMGQLLGQKKPGGFLFRMDLELRPEGASGPLANSLEAMEYYYENFGAFWEKQAMIKVNLAGGSPELFKKFHHMIHPFVYPKTTDYSLLEKVREMKDKVLASVKKSSDKGYHVKLGEGGIREIEFFVQSLQILYGGQRPELQSANTLTAIKKIAKAKIISQPVERSLQDAYLFLRTLENRLQQVEEQQTHRIPESTEERLQLVRRMGYAQEEADGAMERFEQDLSKHRSFVQNTFANLLAKRFEDLQK